MKVLLVFLLVLITTACNMPMPTAFPTPPSTTSPAVLLPATETSPATLLAIQNPTQTPAVVPVRSTVDDFFLRCPTAEEIASVKKDLTLTFESDPSAGTLECKASEGSADLTALQKRAYQSVLIMQVLPFDSPLPWTDKPLYRWFVGTIKGIRFSKTFQYSHCCDPANVIDIKVSDNTYLVLTDKWIDSSIGGGLQDTMVLYVHEARHNEGLPHTCSNGQDDKTISELGAWGVQYYLLLWLAQHVDSGFLDAPGNDPRIYRDTALSDALTIQRSRFCREPTATPGPGPTLAP